ncbi:TOMM precursor leader peptide-binding protein [Amycolatopsis sp. NPDC059657]|uniref:TOMM precursor leader peptide-binding protein n=1 Tax=Amycolatopsis sp. NPDC059657 TaxID=3346899 RepID=UPI00366C6747
MGKRILARFLDFKRHLRAEISEGDGAYLFSETGVIAMRGTQIAALASLLDGTRDFEGLLRAKPAGMDTEQVAALLAQLVEADLVTLRSPADPGIDARTLAYWDACGVDPIAAEQREKSARVEVFALGDSTDAALVDRALRDGGLCVSSGDADVSVVLCDDYLDPRLAEIDEAHRMTGRPWLLAKPVGAQVWLGPVFQPGESACWHCLANRLWGQRHAEACVQAALGHEGPAPRPASAVPPLTSAAAHLISLEVTKWLAGYRYPGQRCVWVLDSLDLRGRLHQLQRRPQCPQCGDRDLMAARATKPVVLRESKKASCGGGGHRTLTAVQMLEKYRHLVSPVTGIVREVTRDESSPSFVNAYRSGVNVVRSMTGMASLRANLRGENGGKGATALDAEVGALCEAVERFSGSYQGDEFRVFGSLRSFGSHAIHPNDCMLYSEQQYRDRAAWNGEHGVMQQVTEPFDENKVLAWTPVWSLSAGKHRLLPTEMLYYGAPDEAGLRSLRADSNGCAAGSSVEDAILQGTLEVIERDAVALWWYNRTPMPGVDLGGFGDPWLEEMTQRYAEIGRELWALDVTSDVGVPVMVAISRELGKPSENIMLGFGAHLDPRTALRRAVSESNQMLAVLCDTDTEFDDPDARRWLRGATVENQPYLLPAGGIPARKPADFRFSHRADIRDDVLALVRALGERGLETLVLDQTRPDVGLPVVKVIVPGMRSFWARFAPGRLFDVPVTLGRSAEPTDYSGLNPFPLFL